jgi:Cu2+-exporting ATPase
MMIVGMVAVALYAGAIQGIEAEWIQLFRWVSLLVATPIVLFSAQPFWAGAWRNLKLCNLTMDVPVSLAIVLAYLASAWATLTQSGEVYFDSITMFTFFLLLGRYFEARLRYRNQQMACLVSQLLPVTVTKVNRSDQSHNIIALAELKEGETIRVASGETIPADGLIVDGSSAIVEALLTGEAEPVLKTVGDSVIAGTVNTEGTLLVDVVAVGDNTRLSTISQLVEEAELEKPKLQQLADKVASVFVAVVLVVALTVYISWRFIDPDVALWVTLSVLVVTCPCALSLATPTALTAALAMMRRQGLLVLKGHVIETLTAITKVIFDKTGTLTYGQPTVVKIEIVGEKDKSFNADKMNVDEEIINEEKIISISAALEKGSSHPIASAFTSRIKEIKNAPIIASHIEITTAAGVSGRVGNDTYRLGKPSFSLQYSKEKMLSKTGLDAASYDELDGELNESKEVPPRVGQWLLLSKNNEAFAWIELSDNLRASAKQVVNGLRASGIKMEILSGDRESTVKLLADELGIAFHAEQTPEKKLALLQRYQKNDTVMMVGDGINDVPVLAGADISIAMDSATDFARTRADSILLNNDLTTLSSIIALSHRTKKIIRQNIVWALGYNLLALPLAAMAYIPPYLAAIGMSASSLIVVLNALRLYNYQYKKTATNTSKQSPMRASSYKK